MAAILIEPSTAALVLIDLQAGIMGIEATPRTVKETLTTCVRLAEACRKAGVKVFLVRVDIGDFQNILADRPSRPAGAPKPPASASVLVPEIGPAEGDIVITKKQWGAFYGTELDLQLRRRGLRTVILGGIATNFGVESTARDAMELGYDLVFAEDAMTSIGAGSHQFAINTIFPKMGRVRATDEIIAGLHP